ncbi:MAG: hypothetical protein WB581_05210 [Halobacteriota archaeon]
MNNNVVRQLGRDPGIITVKRGLALSKSYIVFAIFFTSVAILTANFGNAFLGGVPGNSGIYVGTSLSLLSVALTVIAAVTLTTSVILLYVYDKNNGVLEYFLSLGMNQGDIYKRYLKAGLILVSLLMIAVAVANVAVGLLLRGDVTVSLEATGVAAALSLSVVSFDTMAMMTFSSLQKPRAGANQPLGLALGGLLVVPAYLTPWILPFIGVVVVDLAEAIIIAALSIALFLLSSRLISREKLLP